MQRIGILGSTGSIGKQTLQVASEFPQDIDVVGLAANRDAAGLQEQVRRYRPQYAALAAVDGPQVEGIQRGSDALLEIATASEVDLLVVAIVGAGGLLPTLAALRAGKRVALANKEALVMAGPIIREQLQVGGELVPIDSEHSAIWQCVEAEPHQAIEKLVLTASGGAFRDLTMDCLAQVTPEEAMRHPTWNMGPKITIDCATLMNKGLEVIEATVLFDLPMDQVEVLMHRESIVHSLVYFADSSVKAQLGLPDMRLPIQYALSHPARWRNNLPRLDLALAGSLHFQQPDMDRYPALRLAIQAGRAGGTYPAALCAADEVAVDAFASGLIGFTEIPTVVEQTLERHESCSAPTLDDILQTDATVRESCLRFCEAAGA